MSDRKKTGQGRKGKQTPENTPEKNKVDDTIPYISENEPTAERLWRCLWILPDPEAFYITSNLQFLVVYFQVLVM
jgi:hypothetical protein